MLWVNLNNLKILRIIVLSLCLVSFQEAGDSLVIDSETELITYDKDSSVQSPVFDAQKIEKYSAQPEFDYTEVENDNFWIRFKKWNL